MSFLSKKIKRGVFYFLLSLSVIFSLPLYGDANVNTQVVVDDLDNAHALWVRNTPTITDIQVVFKPNGGSWSSPTSLSPSGDTVFMPLILSNSNGDVVVLWKQVDAINQTWVLCAAVLPFGGSWSSESIVSDPTNSLYDSYDAFMNASGTVEVVWETIIGENVVARSSTGNMSGTWSAPLSIS